jgi:crotonobetainyl-CoA:carnitine CoA-transferase CaiB-like acyl-CoA transferase
VPCGPLLSIDQIFTDPHYKARENLKTIQDPRAGEITVPNVVPRLTATPGRIDHLGPALGTSTDDILGGLLHMAQSQIDALRAKGVI